MATYGDIVTNIMSIIPAPGRETLVRSKVNQIIRYIAGLGDYWKALEETTIDSNDGIDATANIQEVTIDTTTFRSLLYVQYPEAISTDEIRVRNVKDVKHLIACQKDDNIAYVSGTYLRIKNTELTDEFNIGYYVYPADFATDGSEDTSSNWLTIAVPGLIEDLVAAYMLNLIGANEDSKKATDFALLMQPGYIQSQVNGAIS